MIRLWLIRGWTRDHRHWWTFPQMLRRLLPPEADIWMPDLPGTGMYRSVASPCTVSGLADALMRRHCTLPRAEIHILAGLSLGGLVAAEVASRLQATRTGLILINSSSAGLSPIHHRLRPAAWPTLLRAAFSSPKQRERLVLQLTRQYPPDTSLVTQWQRWAESCPVRPQTALAQLVAAARYRMPALPSGSVRIRVIRSLGDRLVNPECSLALSRLLRCPLVTHPSAGHDLPLDAPEWLSDQIIQCLSEIRAAP